MTAPAILPGNAQHRGDRPELPGLRVRLTLIGRSPGAYYDLTVHERIVICLLYTSRCV